MSNDALIDGLEDTIERLKTDNANLERVPPHWRHIFLAQSLQMGSCLIVWRHTLQMGGSTSGGSSGLSYPMISSSSSVNSSFLLVNSAMARAASSRRDHLACISAMPSATLILEPMKCAKCGATTSFLERRDGKFFCETC